MCDITNETSIEGVLKWKHNIDDRILFHGQKIPVLLIGNKADLLNTDEEKDAAANKLKKIAQNNGFQGMLLVSAKTGLNVEETMGNIARLIFNQFGNILEEDLYERNANSIDITLPIDGEQKKTENKKKSIWDDF